MEIAREKKSKHQQKKWTERTTFDEQQKTGVKNLFHFSHGAFFVLLICPHVLYEKRIGLSLSSECQLCVCLPVGIVQ